jgi:NAD(P)-dependent dehydrogenase (short-subunit alcohol dehydrogenase family)
MSSFLSFDLATLDHDSNKILEHIHGLPAFNGLSLVNNAGITLPKRRINGREWIKYSASDWHKTIQINLTAPFQLIELLSPQLITKGRSVVNITSLASHAGFPGNPAYIAAKSGLLGLTRAYAYDFGPYGVKVNSVSPGYIQTSMTQGSFRDREKRENIQHHTSLDRWGHPDDVANCVQFLISDASNYITGTDVRVDGGWLSHGLRI